MKRVSFPMLPWLRKTVPLRAPGCGSPGTSRASNTSPRPRPSSSSLSTSAWPPPVPTNSRPSDWEWEIWAVGSWPRITQMEPECLMFWISTVSSVFTGTPTTPWTTPQPSVWLFNRGSWSMCLARGMRTCPMTLPKDCLTWGTSAKPEPLKQSRMTPLTLATSRSSTKESGNSVASLKTTLVLVSARYFAPEYGDTVMFYHRYRWFSVVCPEGESLNKWGLGRPNRKVPRREVSHRI